MKSAYSTQNVCIWMLTRHRKNVPTTIFDRVWIIQHWLAGKSQHRLQTTEYMHCRLTLIGDNAIASHNTNRYFSCWACVWHTQKLIDFRRNWKKSLQNAGQSMFFDICHSFTRFDFRYCFLFCVQHVKFHSRKLHFSTFILSWQQQQQQRPVANRPNVNSFAAENPLATCEQKKWNHKWNWRKATGKKEILFVWKWE